MALKDFTLAIGNLQDDNDGNNYAVRKAVYILNQNQTLAPIFKDGNGLTPITQDGVNNVTDEYGEFTFWVEIGDYIARVGGKDRSISVGTAQALVSQHNSDPSAHPDLSAFITAEADRAELAAEQAMTAGWVYSTVADGEAVRVDGEYFWVVSNDSKYILELWEMVAVSATDTGKRTINKDYIDSVTNPVYKNHLEFGDFIGGDADMRSTVNFVDFTTQQALIDRGYNRGIEWGLANNFARSSIGSDINSKYVVGCVLIYSENPANLPNVGTVVFSEDSGGSLGSLLNSTTGFISLNENLIIAYQYGQVNQSGAVNLLVGSSESPVDLTRFATGFYATYQDTDFDPFGFIFQQLIKDKSRSEIYKILSIQNFATISDIDQAILGYSQDGLNEGVSNIMQNEYANQFINGDFVSSDAKTRSGSDIVNINIPEMNEKGLYRGVNHRTVSNDYLFTNEIGDLVGKYFVSAYYIHSESGDFPTTPFTFESDSDENITLPSPRETLIIDISSTMKLVMFKAQVAESDTVKFAIGSSYTPTSSDVYSSGYYLALSDSDINFYDVLPSLFSMDKARKQIRNNILSGKSYIELNGENEDSYIFGFNDGDSIKRVINPYPETTNLELTKVFNFNGDYINGDVVKTGADDVAPQRANDTTIGANHGYIMGDYLSASHGKTNDDVGSIYSVGAAQFVILGIKSVDNLWIANTVSNLSGDLPNGTFLHVSGGSNQSDFSATLISAKQFYPPFQDYNMNIIVDGDRVESGARVSFSDSVKFIETYEILSRSELLDWYVNQNTGGNIYPSGMSASYRVNNIYEFNTAGDCVIYSDIVFLQSTPVQDLMFLQAQRNELDRYYLPKAIEFTQGSETLNYSLIESSTATSSTGIGTINFGSAKMESGLLIDRVVGFNDSNNTCFAMGYLPIYSCELATRLANTTNKAWEIRGNTDKLYPRALDKGDFTAVAGEVYSVVGYRNVYKKPSGEETSAYPVKSSSGDYYFIDWHDKQGIYNILLPDDFQGKPLEVVESRNATLISQFISNSITIDVNCLSDYGYLVIKA